MSFCEVVPVVAACGSSCTGSSPEHDCGACSQALLRCDPLPPPICLLSSIRKDHRLFKIHSLRHCVKFWCSLPPWNLDNKAIRPITHHHPYPTTHHPPLITLQSFLTTHNMDQTQNSNWSESLYILTTTRVLVVLGSIYLIRSLIQLIQYLRHETSDSRGRGPTGNAPSCRINRSILTAFFLFIDTVEETAETELSDLESQEIGEVDLGLGIGPPQPIHHPRRLWDARDEYGQPTHGYCPCRR